MRFFLCTLICVIIQLHASAQSYITYQQIFNRIDEEIIADRLPASIPLLDSIYSNYSFIYARHCFKALQISCKLNDSSRVNLWLQKSFLQGIPLWAIQANDIAKLALAYNNTRQTVLQYDSLHAEYLSHINKELTEEVNRLLAIDYRHTNRVNNGFIPLRYTIYGLQWLRNNKREFARINKLIEKYGFPGERLIGLPYSDRDSAKGTKFILQNGPAVELQDRRVFFMLLHYYSSPGKDINTTLYPFIGQGYLPAYQYGRINDFIVLYGGRNGKRYLPYHVQHPAKGNTDIANKTRAAIGLNTFEQQERNKSIELQARKTGMINNTIILE